MGLARSTINKMEFSVIATRLSGMMGVLFHWSVEQFWAATPQEVAVLFDAMKDLRGEGVGASPPDADAFAALRMRFPD